MIRKLRVKLVAIIMAFVTVILACVMAAVLGLTRATLERESLDMMRHIALNPIQVPAPGEEFDGVRLPYIVLSVGEDGTIEPAGGGYYDLSDTEFLQQAAEEAVDSGRQNDCICRYIERNANLNWIVPYLPAALQCGVYCVLKSA